jgi:PAS domain S-box-containing protein
MGHGGHERSHHAVKLTELATELRKEFPAVLSAGAVGGFLWDRSSALVYLDPVALSIFDLSPDDYDGRLSTLGGRVPPEDRSAFRALVRKTAEQHDEYGIYFRVQRPDGGLRWARMEGSVRRNADGRATGVAGIVRDASADFEHPRQQAVAETDRERQAGIVEATVSALSRALTVEDVTAALTNELAGPLGATNVSLEIVEQGKLRLFVTPVLLTPEAYREIELSRWDETRLDQQLPAHTAIRTQVPLFLDREAARIGYPRLWPYIRDTKLAASAVLPLIAQTRPIGALGIHYNYRKTFTPEERNLLTALASAAAQSVQRAILYDQNLAMAVGLQQAMLPAHTPEVIGARIAVRYQPATTGQQIGGDWYDVVPLPGGRVGLVIGDVQGHDIHASAVMGQLRTALRAYAAEGHPPATLMSRASTFLHDLDTDRFATCLYADLDPITGHTQFIRAGHHGPLLRHADGSTTRPDLRGGLPLGLTQYDSTPYPTTHLRLHPQETLLLCTDGLIESHRMSLDEGIQRVETILRDGPANTDLLAERIMRSVETGQTQEDDIALLLLTRTGPARS